MKGVNLMNAVEGAGLAGYCGLYCGACAILNGQIRDTAKSLRGLLKAYDYAEWAPTLADFVPAVRNWGEFEGVLEWLTTQDCSGCPAGGGNPECAIRICARERRLAGCWECDEEPCEKLGEIDEGYPGVAKNRQRIRELGLEAWLAEQKAQVEAGFSYADVLGKSE